LIYIKEKQVGIQEYRPENFVLGATLIQPIFILAKISKYSLQRIPLKFSYVVLLAN